MKALYTTVSMLALAMTLSFTTGCQTNSEGEMMLLSSEMCPNAQYTGYTGTSGVKEDYLTGIE